MRRRRPPTRAEPRPTTRGPRSRAEGFTLVELLVTLLVSSILLAVGAIRLGRATVLRAEGERVAHRLVADLRYTQSQAIAESTEHHLRFDRAVGGKFPSYAIYRKENGWLQIEPTRALPDGVAVQGDDDAIFYPGGDAKEHYAYTITSPGRTYRITVTLATGAVQLQEL